MPFSYKIPFKIKIENQDRKYRTNLESRSTLSRIHDTPATHKCKQEQSSKNDVSWRKFHKIEQVLNPRWRFFYFLLQLGFQINLGFLPLLETVHQYFLKCSFYWFRTSLMARILLQKKIARAPNLFLRGITANTKASIRIPHSRSRKFLDITYRKM